jgi:hypothetical protein
MFKSVAVRVFAALVIVAVMGGGAGQAMAGLPGEVAHSAMGGSTLMPTTAQFSAWTHWIVNHDEFVELNVSDSSTPFKTADQTTGQAALHWKYNDNNHLLFRVRQWDLGGQNSNFVWGGTLGNSFLSPAELIDMLSVSDYNAYAEGQMINLALARPLGGGGAFSFGLLYADAGEKDSAADPETENKSSAFGAQVTWGNGNGLDLAGSFFSESSTAGGGDAEAESDFTHFDLTARIDRGNGWIYQVGALMGSGTVGEDDISLMGVIGNVGRHLVQTDEAGVTAEFYVNYFGLTSEPEGGAEYKETTMTVPGTRVAAWTQISRRWQIMAGANAFWSTTKEEVDADGGMDESSRGMNFSYTGGVAFIPSDNIRIEGELDMGNLNRLLTLGNEQPMLLRVGTTVVF